MNACAVLSKSMYEYLTSVEKSPRSQTLSQCKTEKQKHWCKRFYRHLVLHGMNGKRTQNNSIRSSEQVYAINDHLHAINTLTKPWHHGYLTVTEAKVLITKYSNQKGTHDWSLPFLNYKLLFSCCFRPIISLITTWQLVIVSFWVNELSSYNSKYSRKNNTTVIKYAPFSSSL